MPPPSLPFERSHPYDVGVLLVHGIGEQRKGDTLLAAGRALVDVLQARLDRLAEIRRRAGVATPAVKMRVELHRDESGQPARAEITLAHLDALVPAGGASTSRILIAESWWAEAFPQPSEVEVFRWMVDVLPATLVSHFDRRLRRAIFEVRNPDNLASPIGKYLRLVRESASLLAAIVLVPPLLCALAVVLLVGFLPIPFVDALARGLQRVIATTIGDSYVLLGNPLAQSAIVETVAADQRWLADRCERLMVVAHSQGGAIAHEMVRADPLTPCEHLLTYGSGLHKLAFIQEMKARGQALPLWGAVAGLFLASATLATWLSGAWLGGWRALCLPIGLVSLAGAAVALWQWQRRSERHFSHERQWKADRDLFTTRFRFANDRVRWRDVYAVDDPVPNGPLLDEYEPRELAAAVTRNYGSTLRDHTAYWENRDDFVSQVARTLLGLAGIDVPALDADDADWQDAASSRRRWRVAWRRAGTWAALAAAAAVAWQLWLAPQPLVARAYAWLHAIAADTPWIGATIAPAGAAPFHSATGLAIVGVMALLAVAIVQSVWAYWNAGEMARFFEQQPYSNTSGGFLGYLGAVAALLLAATAYRFGAPMVLGVAGFAIALTLVVAVGARGRLPVLERLRRRAVTGTLAEIRGRWRESFERELVRNVEKGRRWSLHWLGLRQLRSSDAADQARGVAALRRAAHLGLVPAASSLGDHFVKQQDWRAARGAFNIGRHLRDGWCALQLGHLYERAGKVTAAIRAYQQAIDLGEPFAANALGSLHAGRNRPREARRAFQQGVVRGDRLSTARRGRLYRDAAARCDGTRHARLRARMRAGAVACYTQAIELGDEIAARELGAMLEGEGHPAGAIAAFAAGVRLGDERSALALGRLQLAEGRTEAGERTLQRAMEMARRRLPLTPGEGGDAVSVTAQAAFELGRLREERGQPAVARRFYEESLRLIGQRDEGRPAALRLGRLHDAAGEGEQAEAAFRRGLDCGSSQCGVELAARLGSRGAAAEARSACDRALAALGGEWTLSDADHAVVRVAAAAFLRSAGDGDRATTVLVDALHLRSATVERDLADLIIDRGDIALGVAQANAYWCSPTARLRLARFLLAAGEPAAAREALRVFPRGSSLDEEVDAATLWEELGDVEQAGWRYDHALRQGSAEAASRLIALLTRTGDQAGVARTRRDARLRGLATP